MFRQLKLVNFVPRSVRRAHTFQPLYILTPEIPPGTYSTAETNEVLNLKKVPSTFNIPIKKCRDAVGVACVNLESHIWQVEELLQDPENDLLTLFNSVDPGELEHVRTIIFLVHVTQDLQNYSELIERTEKAKSLRYSSTPLYDAAKELLEKNPRHRFYRQAVFRGKLHGADAKTEFHRQLLRTKYAEIQKLIQEFQTNVSQANAAFKHLIVDEAHMGDMSLSTLAAIAKDKSNPSRGPWVLNLNKQVYNSFLECSPTPAVRWNMWQAYNNRCKDSNLLVIDSMRKLRKIVADTLGAKSYADLFVGNLAAGSTYNVKSMIASLLLKGMPQQKNEIKRLQEFANANGDDTFLMPWDIPYWRRRERKELFGPQEFTFPFQEALSKLLTFTSKMFGIEYEKITDTHYKVHNKSSLLGQIVLDPFRSAKKFPGTYVIRSNLFSALVTNFEPPFAGNEAVLSYQDLHNLFLHFGHTLQSLGTPYPDAFIPDFKVVGPFLTMWLGNKAFMNSSFGLSGEALDNFLKSRLHFTATDLCDELYSADLDLELCMSTDIWSNIVDKLYAAYHVIGLEGASPLCSSQIVSSGGTYYTSLWSRMLAADCYRAFVESKEPKDISVDGARFYNSFVDLTEETLCSQRFRAFRGRDPSPDALLWSLGLQKLDRIE